MKPFILFLILFTFCTKLCGQAQYLFIKSSKLQEQKVIDSIGYQKKHINAKMVTNELENFKKKVLSNGFINTTIEQQSKLNDSTFIFEIMLRERILYLDINLANKFQLEFIGSDNTQNVVKKISFNEAENFLSSLSKKLESKGYSQAKVKLTNIMQHENRLTADIDIHLGTKRVINDIVITGYDKFPSGVKKNILRRFKQQTFTTDNLQKIKTTFDNLNFVSQSKYPEILFTKDTTKVYVYLKKAKANVFDGLVGFGTDENAKVRFNGYLDLVLLNTINAGERFNLNWKNDGRNQTNFDVGAEVPYIFKSRFLLKAHLNIFKQDSLFQNTKLFADLGYFLKSNIKLFVGYESTESASIQSVSTTNTSFEKQFTTFQFDYQKNRDRENAYFSILRDKSYINLKVGFGKRTTFDTSEGQSFATLEGNHNFDISQRLRLNLRTQSSILTSTLFFTNELFRFGGINSIRGFNENSLQANAFTSALSEIRYAITPTLYVHTLADYGFYDDKTTNKNGQLLGIGAGFGLFTKNGLLQFIYAYGQQEGTGSSLVHVNYKIGF